MAVGVLMIGLFNYKTTICGRVTLLLPTVIAKEITLLSRVFSVAATGIPLLACTFRSTGSALVEDGCSNHY